MFNYPFVGSLSKKNKKLAVSTTQIKEKGKNTFQPNLINWSYRYLGTIDLTNAKSKKRNKILNIIQKTPGTPPNG